jgi:predicted DsbA family dithiol-disulfide isomerase
VACPWCYIGKARFERALGAFAGADAVEVSYRPYQLDPRAPAPSVPMLDYLERRFGGRARAMATHVIQTARGEGLTMDYDRGLAANTLAAHRLMRLAEQEHGPAVQRTLAERLFEAHFAEGRDVNDVDVLAELAAEAGVDRERARAYLASDEGVREVREEITAAQQLGISAVPTFVFDGKYAVEGAQPTSVFLQALEAVARETAATGGEQSGELCADGACSV